MVGHLKGKGVRHTALCHRPGPSGLWLPSPDSRETEDREALAELGLKLGLPQQPISCLLCLLSDPDPGSDTLGFCVLSTYYVLDTILTSLCALAHFILKTVP